MADKKISALPAATTPLAGTEVLPIVQGGTTDQVSVANLTSGRFVNMDSATVGSTSSAAYGSKLRVDGGIETFSSQYNIFSGSNTQYELVNRAGGAGFDFYVNGAGKLSVRFLSSGDVSLTDNLVIGTAGKGIDFSAATHAAGMTSELLSDYEEGTWTPTQGAGLTVVGTFTSEGTYTKVGRLVTVRGAVFATTISCTSAGIICGGLPFASALDTAGSRFDGTLSNGGVIDANSSNINSVGAIAGTTAIYFNVTYMV